MSPEVITLLINIGISALVGAGTAIFVIGQYKAKVDRVIEDQKACDEKRTAMKTHVDQLLEFKTQAQKFMDKNIYKDQSPLSLTDFGNQLVDESGFRGIFDTVKDDLVTMLEAQSPTGQYDVQEKARALMDSLDTYEAFQPIKTYAFDHGKDFNQILRAGGILLRDYYFEKHPEVVNPKEQW